MSFKIKRKKFNYGGNYDTSFKKVKPSDTFELNPWIEKYYPSISELERKELRVNRSQDVEDLPNMFDQLG